MDELVTDSATRPPSPEHRFVPIEVFLAHSAEARSNRKRHRLPFPTAFSNTHRTRSIAGRPAETQAKEKLLLSSTSRNPISRFSLQMHHSSHIDDFPFDGTNHFMGKPQEKIAPEPILQDAPSCGMFLNLAKCRLNRLNKLKP